MICIIFLVAWTLASLTTFYKYVSSSQFMSILCWDSVPLSLTKFKVWCTEIGSVVLQPFGIYSSPWRYTISLLVLQCFPPLVLINLTFGLWSEPCCWFLFDSVIAILLQFSRPLSQLSSYKNVSVTNNASVTKNVSATKNVCYQECLHYQECFNHQKCINC